MVAGSDIAEIATRLDPSIKVIVSGHTHVQFDRIVGETRLVKYELVGLDKEAHDETELFVKGIDEELVIGAEAIAEKPAEEEKEKTVTLNQSVIRDLRQRFENNEERVRVRQGVRPGMMTVSWIASDPNSDEMLYRVEMRSVDREEAFTVVADDQLDLVAAGQPALGVDRCHPGLGRRRHRAEQRPDRPGRRTPATHHRRLRRWKHIRKVCPPGYTIATACVCSQCSPRSHSRDLGGSYRCRHLDE